MAQWSAKNVVRIGPPGDTIQVEFDFEARFTAAADGFDLLHKGRYRKSVTGTTPALKQTFFINEVEKVGGMIAQIKANHLGEEAKGDVVTTALGIEIVDRNVATAGL